MGWRASYNLPAAALPSGRQSAGAVRSEELSLMQFPFLKGCWGAYFSQECLLFVCLLSTDSSTSFLQLHVHEGFLAIFPFLMKTANGGQLTLLHENSGYPTPGQLRWNGAHSDHLF